MLRHTDSSSLLPKRSQMKPTLKFMLETEADLQRSHAPVGLARFLRCGMRAAGILSWAASSRECLWRFQSQIYLEAGEGS